jgi:hypothetical protein
MQKLNFSISQYIFDSKLTKINVAWWNVENLFDIMPWEDRARKIKNVGSSLKSDLENWDETKLNKKLEKLAEIIKEMNNNEGPDILGVCEVENEEVLLKLIEKVKTGNLANRNYGVIHYDGPDSRGIDVAFIYDKDIFEFHIKNPNAPEGSDDRKYWFSHEIIKRSPTRDILQVNFHLKEDPDKLLILVGNHWPSRISGDYETEPYRIIAAETLSYFNLRIQEVLGRDTPILVMGDFNDEPGNRALTDYALSMRNQRQVLNATKNPCLFNLMWPLMDTGYGTYWYDGPLFFDQFLVSRGFLKENANLSVVENSPKVILSKKMWEKPNGYPKPRRFGTKEIDELGYSDHFPISIKLTT